MDVVYICRPGDDNEELRYSLRSLRNVPHDRVFLVGDAPSWVRNVEVMRVPRGRDKQVTAQNNLIEACKSSEISDPFLIMNDDFYIMEPMQEVPLWHMGEVPEVIDKHKLTGYRIAMEKTYARLLEIDSMEGIPVSFELHIPMVIEKLGMQMALSLGADIYGLHNRTMYGNLMGLGATFHEDVKVYRNTTDQGYRVLPLLSTSDRTFKYHHAGRYIRETFREPSVHEFVPKARTAERRRIYVITPH